MLKSTEGITNRKFRLLAAPLVGFGIVARPLVPGRRTLLLLSLDFLL
jgi:hypothetical protein